MSRDDGDAGDVGRALAEIRERTEAVTTARIFRGRVDGGYRTRDLLDLRADHAAARDAVRQPLSLDAPDLAAVVAEHELFEVATQAESIDEHLLRPDRGRRFSDAARETIAERCEQGADLQVVIGDGLSSAAVAAQIPALLPLVVDGARERGWDVGQPFVVRHARVGLLNEIGELLEPDVVVLLVGERPGLLSADGLSAYLAYRPRPGHTDADRNLLSNIRDRGTPPRLAARRILDLAAAMRNAGLSGVKLKEPDPPDELEEGGTTPKALPGA